MGKPKTAYERLRQEVANGAVHESTSLHATAEQVEAIEKVMCNIAKEFEEAPPAALSRRRETATNLRRLADVQHKVASSLRTKALLHMVDEPIPIDPQLVAQIFGEN